MPRQPYRESMANKESAGIRNIDFTGIGNMN